MGQQAQFIHDYGPSLLVVFGFAVQALILYGKRGSDFKVLAEWRVSPEAEAKQRDQAIAALHTLAATSQATAASQGAQLALVQQELRDNRTKRPRG